MYEHKDYTIIDIVEINSFTNYTYMVTHKSSPAHGLNNQNFKYKIKYFRRFFFILNVETCMQTL